MNPIVRTAAAVGAVALSVGCFVAMGWLDFYGPSGWSWLGAVTGVFATVLGAGVALYVGRHPATAVLLLLALPFCGFFIYRASEALVPAVRGTSGDCRVDGVNTTGRTVLNGAPEGGTSDVVRHVHRLTCPRGGPSEMSTQDDRFPAGTTLSVTWDPSGRVEPIPTRDVPGTGRLVLPSTAVVAVLLLAATAGTSDSGRAREDPRARRRSP